ncbi:hypothetical protein [Pelobacter propionicus]|uniref:GCN5-related N-acetyltransferase n=1 Tax=Pelobacter propionicus (strain DSM 2379 / NBRC 103807 / OttBd1) TaxID=338966 RepID=A1AV23_PELPD|nr:hypothetical protein [Pelobacter propionicus]ABL01194.1 hypothetical protein Ppro_3602 [Pelobacter propionicus DSM 2379]
MATKEGAPEVKPDRLLADAIKRIVLTTKMSGGVTGFFVDAKDEKARQFYLRFGFIPLEDDPLKLFLPLNTLANGIKSAMTA